MGNVGGSSTGHFSRKQPIGEGGIGRVFIAFDENIKRPVAIKELASDKLGRSKAKAEARLVREARISGQLEHPGVVPVYELSKDPDGSHYYVMKYVQGRTLGEAIKACRAGTPEEAYRNRMTLFGNFIAVCDAMGYAHSRRVIHRDLKPGNVILGDYGETLILDWGLAKTLDEIESGESDGDVSSSVDDGFDADLTAMGARLGTPSYMSPEQIDSKFGNVSERSDVYSLGVIFYMILTGEKPYEIKGREAMKIVASDEPSPSPLARGAFIPHELAAICEKAMSKDPNMRFKDASEMASELKAYRDGRLVSIYSYSRMELFRRFIQRNKVGIAAAAAVILSIFIGAAFSVKFGMDAHSSRLRAEHALVDVTELSESAMEMSRKSTQDLSDYIGGLIGDMEAMADDLNDVNFFDNDAWVVSARRLDDLEKKYPSIYSLSIHRPDGLSVHTLDDAENGYLDTFDDAAVISEFKEKGSVVKGLQRDGDLYYMYIRVPIFGRTKISGILSMVMTAKALIPAALSFDPLKSDYRVWCMAEDGQVLYDEDEKQLGKNLFTDSIYVGHPELQVFGKRMLAERWGLSHYVYPMLGDDHEVYKIAAWDTFDLKDDESWKIVITYAYESHEGR